MEKACIFCKKLEWYCGAGSNCPTCGYGPESEMKCAEGHWNENMMDGDLKSYRQKIGRAKTCKDYELVDLDS